MRALNFFVLVTCLLAAAVVQAQQAQSQASSYRLGPGDVLRITVFGEEDLSFEEITISDAGTFIYPFLGELHAGGMSIGQLSSTITAKLKDGWLVDPSVNVLIVGYRQFYIDGEVEEPGGYPYQPGLTLQRAVALAGGFTERASSSKFFRRSENGGGEARIGLDALIQPGDSIRIQDSFF